MTEPKIAVLPDALGDASELVEAFEALRAMEPTLTLSTDLPEEGDGLIVTASWRIEPAGDSWTYSSILVLRAREVLGLFEHVRTRLEQRAGKRA